MEPGAINRQEGHMPKFIDHHAKVPPKPPEEIEMLKALVREKKVDAFGTRIMEGYFTETGGGLRIRTPGNKPAYHG
jgi:hypothetical protein